MIRYLILTIILTSSILSRGATNIVLAGEDIQAKVNAASPGDILVIQGAAYGGALTINKGLTLLQSGQTEVKLQGAVKVETPQVVTFSRIAFESTLAVTNGSDLRMYDSQVKGLFIAHGGKVTLKRSGFEAGIEITNADADLLRITNSAHLRATAELSNPKRLVMTQSKIGWRTVLNNYRSWIGYNTMYPFESSGADATLIGNKMTLVSGLDTLTAVLFNNGKISAYNNSIYMSLGVCGGIAAFHLTQAQGEIINNTIRSDGYDPGCWQGIHGILAQNGTGMLKVKNCVFSFIPFSGLEAWTLVEAQNQQIELSHCASTPELGPWYAGLNPSDAIVVNPRLVFNEWTLEPDSPCVNAGDPNPIYNDRDGTRNDMGLTGGPLYNPEFYTTDKPIPFWLMATPRQVLKGVQNSIRLEAAAAAGH